MNENNDRTHPDSGFGPIIRPDCRKCVLRLLAGNVIGLALYDLLRGLILGAL